MTSLNDIEQFWDAHPCGESLVGREDDWRSFFERYDRYRYSTEGHILKEMDGLDLSGKDVLEIGIGQAADSAQLIARGAHWHGLDLTAEAIARAKKRFALFDLPFMDIKQGSADSIPYPNQTFDLVYSHGVLHHIPQIRKVSSEIRRVLKPGGLLVVMLYHKRSLNYLISINIIRRVLMFGLAGLSVITGHTFQNNRILGGHLKNVKQFGLLPYLKNPLFMTRNTDGPENPYSKVYDLTDVAADFPDFQIVQSRVHFLNERHLLILRLFPKRLKAALESKYGWHLWVVMK